MRMTVQTRVQLPFNLRKETDSNAAPSTWGVGARAVAGRDLVQL